MAVFGSFPDGGFKPSQDPAASLLHVTRREHGFDTVQQSHHARLQARS